MKRFIMTALALTTLAATVVPANAQMFINGSQSRLQSRINAGVRSGALTRGEASRLQSKLNQINDLEFRMRNSGSRLSWQERQRLQDKLNNLSNDINRQLNDFDHNFNGGYRGGNRWHR